MNLDTTISTFDLQKGVEGDKIRQPAPDGPILGVLGKPLAELPKPMLYRDGTIL